VEDLRVVVRMGMRGGRGSKGEREREGCRSWVGRIHS
jgi:ribosomal protein L15